MIKEIIDTFYQLAREHKLIRSFKYDKLSKGAGTGEEDHPQFFLEDPIYVGDSSPMDGTIRVQVNFDIIMTPQAFENWNVKKQLTVDECQNVAHQIALNIVSRLRTKLIEDDNVINMSILEYSFITLRNWYDNAAAGVRCTMNLSVANPINLCDESEHFDENKEFHLSELLNDVDTSHANGCHENFSYKLPKITL